MNKCNTYKMVAKGLMDTTMTRQELYNRLLEQSDGSDFLTPTNDTAISPCGPLEIDSQHMPSKPGASPANRSQRSGTSVALSPSSAGNQQSEPQLAVDATMSIQTGTSPTCGDERSLPYFSEYETPSTVADWTGPAWSVEAMEGHLSSLSTRDCLPWCLFCKDPFLQDFAKGGGRYCSPALVNALFALCTRGTNDVETSGRPNGSSGGTLSSFHEPDSLAFFTEANILVSNGDDANSLPDTQALGMLALYQLGRGCGDEAQKLADAFAGAVTKLFLQNSYMPDELGSQYKQVCATTYCGAISLAR